MNDAADRPERASGKRPSNENDPLLLERILRERFEFPPEAASFVRGDLELAAELVAPQEIERVSRDLADDVVLAVAKAGRVDRIVAGDRDLLSLARYGSAEVVDPRQFVKAPRRRKRAFVPVRAIRLLNLSPAKMRRPPGSSGAEVLKGLAAIPSDVSSA